MSRLNKSSNPGIRRAANKAIDALGGSTAAARLMLPPDAPQSEVTRYKDIIRKWRFNGVPPHWVNRVNDLTGISRHEMCPTVFRKDD